MNLQKKLANLLATTKRKRPYYCEVEYLQTSGTQYIDTGLPVHFNEDTITLIAELTEPKEYQTVYSVFESFDGTVQFFAVRQLSTQEKWQSVGIQLSFPDYELNKKFKLQLSKVDETYFQYLGETVYTGRVNDNKDTSFTGYVFATNNRGSAANNAIGKIYAFQQKRAGSLIRDLIPVLDWNMTPCMYDKVSGELFYNAGNGEFLCGREIHPVDYLESTGTQWIDTEYIGNSNTKVEVKCYSENTSQNRALFGARDDGGYSNSFTVWQVANNKIRFDYSAEVSAVKVTIDWDPTIAHTIVKDGAKNYVDGVEVTSNNPVAFDCNFPFSLFGVNTGGSVQTGTLLIGCVYYCKVWDNNILVRDYIPAVDENGIGFMFDRVSHTIFDNVGTGAFVYPPVKLESPYIVNYAMWDGKWNDGWCKHNADTTVCKNLVGDFDITGSVYGDLSFTGTTGAPSVWSPKDQIFNGNFTFEWSSNPDVELTNVIMNVDNGVNSANRYRVSGVRSGYANYQIYYWNGSASVAIYPMLKANYYQGAIVFDNGVFSVYGNGELINKYEDAVMPTDAIRCQIVPNITFNNIRVSSRALTANEIAHNYKIDKARFGL